MAGEIVVYITVSSKQEAEKIAQVLLDAKKAACVQIFPEIESHYVWKGKRETSKEVFVMVKTLSSKLEDVVKLVKQVHSYEVPEIIALPIVGGNPDYLRWIASSFFDSAQSSSQ